MLQFLWSFSIGMAAVSLAVMAALIVVRVVTQRRERRDTAIRQQVLERIFKWLDQEVDETGVGDLSGVPPRILQALADDLLGLLSGAERDLLAAFFRRAGVPASLIRDLRARSVRLALPAAERLARFPGDDTVVALRRALDHRHPDVRLAAALSLADLGAAPRIGELIERLDIGTVEQSLLVGELLRRIEQKNRTGMIRLTANENAPQTLRGIAVEVLGATGDPELIEPLARLAESDNVDLAAKAVRGLGQIGTPAVEPAIRAALENPRWQVRVQAAVAAGRLGLPGLVDALAPLVADETWWVRYRAAEALLALGEAGIAKLKTIVASENASGKRFTELLMSEKGMTWAG